MNIFKFTSSKRIFWKGTGIFFLSILFATNIFVTLGVNTQIVLAESPVPGDPNFIGPTQSNTGLVPCDGPRSIAGSDNRTCNFQSFIRGINFIINEMLIIAVPLSLISFAYAGILFMSGKEDKISQGKEIFTKVVWGVVIMAGGWLLVHTLIAGLLDPKSGIGAYLYGI